jgi:hypothetical protein
MYAQHGQAEFAWVVLLMMLHRPAMAEHVCERRYRREQAYGDQQRRQRRRQRFDPPDVSCSTHYAILLSRELREPLYLVVFPGFM